MPTYDSRVVDALAAIWERAGYPWPVRLKARKTRLQRRLYGRTKPGTLLKHHIPIKTDAWRVTTPGFAEIDLVAHCGQTAVLHALQEMAHALPFPLRGLDSDNGSEFINHHLLHYTQRYGIQFTRGRPYKKDDDAHIEQKN